MFWLMHSRIEVMIVEFHPRMSIAFVPIIVFEATPDGNRRAKVLNARKRTSKQFMCGLKLDSRLRGEVPKYPKARPCHLAVNSNTLLSWHKHGNVCGLKCSGGVYTRVYACKDSVSDFTYHTWWIFSTLLQGMKQQYRP